MPGIDGGDLAAQVRALRPQVGVVFISGYVPDHRRVEGLPGRDLLPKPFTPLVGENGRKARLRSIARK